VLFNDRYGMQRLYYNESREAFYFAAEAKAVLAVCPNFVGRTRVLWENLLRVEAFWKTERCSMAFSASASIGLDFSVRFTANKKYLL